MKKIRVAILFGGQSAEHEVSIQSAHNVATALDPEKYEVIPIAIDSSGQWLPPTQAAILLQSPQTALPTRVADHTLPLAILTNISSPSNLDQVGIDVVFPALHGPLGEDGTIQGLLKLAHIPFVGAGVLGSAVGMDKDVMKRLLRDAGLNIAPFVAVQDFDPQQAQAIVDQLGLPLFVKPANLGSSIGMTKVHQLDELEAAVIYALQYDRKAIIETAIEGREIEVAVLGNQNPKASVPGEIIPHHEYYSYEAKYIDENGAELIIPADLPADITAQIQEQAITVFKTICCEGMGRVDFFISKDNQIFVNEINTIPGFTNISMYPMLWKASGVSYAELVDTLIQLAIERSEQEEALRISRS